MGSGTISQSLLRNSTAFFLQYKTYRFLLDCGPGVFSRVTEQQIFLKDLSGICITHFHPDHISDLIPILFNLKYAKENQRDDNLVIIVHESFSDLVPHVEKILGIPIAELPVSLRYISEYGDISIDDDVSISYIAVNHKKESLGYVFDLGGIRIGFTGDTDFCENLFTLIEKSDIVFTECAVSEHSPISGHLDPDKIQQLLDKTNVAQKMIYLTHFYPEVENSDLLGNLLKNNPNIKLTYDGLKIIRELS